jgi:hypothetical protein
MVDLNCLENDLKAATNRDEDYKQFCFELYCDALRLSAQGDGLSRDWESVTERVWLAASKAVGHRCVTKAARKRIRAAR